MELQVVSKAAAAMISFAQIRKAVDLHMVPNNLLLQNNGKWRFTVPAGVGGLYPSQEGMDATVLYVDIVGSRGQRRQQQVRSLSGCHIKFEQKRTGEHVIMHFIDF